MKERPILFSAPMVRAILNGTKTQTRRVAKKVVAVHDKTGEALSNIDSAGPRVLCPYGQPGDRLWVRESFQPFLADGVDHWKANWETGEGYAVGYPATDGIREFIDADDNLKSTCKPSIHMPRWASRITLEITGVRVERLQDISPSDCEAEGVRRLPLQEGALNPWYTGNVDAGLELHSRSTIGAYHKLWEKINGAGSWDANPWVWVIEFKRMKGGAA